MITKYSDKKVDNRRKIKYEQQIERMNKYVEDIATNIQEVD